eukprot:5853167-Prymnesium_polylepis.1
MKATPRRAAPIRSDPALSERARLLRTHAENASGPSTDRPAHRPDALTVWAPRSAAHAAPECTANRHPLICPTPRLPVAPSRRF